MGAVTEAARPRTTGDARAVAVIGAGIAGLAAAWAVRRAGIPVVVLESAARAGGVITTQRRGDFLAELGPTSAMMTPELAQLIGELGPRLQRIAPLSHARRRFIARGGRAMPVPLSPPAAIASPLLSARGKLRALGDLVLPRARRDGPEESLATLARRRFGQEVLDYLIDPMVSGIYAGDPGRLSSRHVVRALHDLEQQHGSVIRGVIAAARARTRAASSDSAPSDRSMFSFRGGLRELPDAVAGALGDAVRLRTRVRSLAIENGQWVVACDGAMGDSRIAVSAVVATVPAGALDSIELPVALRRRIAPISGVADVPVATVALGFRRADIAHSLDGFGVLMPRVERSGVLGALFSSSIFAGRAPAGSALITCMIGGARDRQAVDESDEALVRRAMAAIGPLLGITGAPTFVHAMRWRNAIPQYEVGHDEVLASAERAECEFDGLILAGSYRDGVSIGDRVAAGVRAGGRAAAVGPIAAVVRTLG